MRTVFFLALTSSLLCFTSFSLAEEGSLPLGSAFVEERTPNKNSSTYYEQLKKSRLKSDDAQMEQGSLIQSTRLIYAKFSSRLRVPGFISATPLPQMAKIVGPNKHGTLLRVGDTTFVRWSGAPLPRPGDRYATFTPAIVVQNLVNPTEFTILPSLATLETLPKNTRQAGYFYETTGRLKIIRIRNGLMEAMVEQLKGALSVGDELMQEPPKLENITPIRSGIQLSAAVICGSPHDRLSTTKRSYIYINRGSRDGIRVGRVFESIESVELDQTIGGPAPLISNGEAIVIHTTDSYSTAMITEQFDVIRIGSLLRTQQETSPVMPVSPFDGYKEENAAMRARYRTPEVRQKSEEIPEVPSLNNLPGAEDSSLPEPGRTAPEPQLSELDSMERSLRTKELSVAEKARLGKLSQQEKLKSANLEELEEDNGIPGAPSLENSFQDPKKKAKSDKKPKKKAKNDEEELNKLMMDN